MCIIVVKKKGVELPSESIFKNCFYNNDDGAGFMYNYNGKVIIQKGFMTYKDFKDALDNALSVIDNPKDTGMVFHFRITTQGGTNPQNCHPFPVTHEENLLRQTYVTTELGAAHNGIISLTSSYGSYYYYGKQVKNPDSHLSDTQIFIRDYLSTIKKMKSDFYKDKMCLKLVEKLIDSKMCFLDGNGNITTVGSFVTEDDVLYSNSTYSYAKVRTYVPSTKANKTSKNSDYLYGRADYNYGYYDDYDDYDGYVLVPSAKDKNSKPHVTQKYAMLIDRDCFWYNEVEGDAHNAGEVAVDWQGMIYAVDEEYICPISTGPADGIWPIDPADVEEIKYDFKKGKMFKLVTTESVVV